MPLKSLSELTASLFPETATGAADSARPIEPRQKGRAADWRGQIARAHAYAQGRARSPEEAARITSAYEEALDRGPDFTRYRRGSGFMDAPKISLDRNALARIKFMLEAIRRGSWKVKEKGKHAGDIKHSVIEVFDALVRLAMKHGRVFPSLVGLAQLATRSKQTVVNALAVLEFYGFVTRHRRIMRIDTPLGARTVQATNAYTIQEPNAWGRLSYAVFMGNTSESKNPSARKPDSYSSKEELKNSAHRMPWEGTWADLEAAWEAT